MKHLDNSKSLKDMDWTRYLMYSIGPSFVTLHLLEYILSSVLCYEVVHKCAEHSKKYPRVKRHTIVDRTQLTLFFNLDL